MNECCHKRSFGVIQVHHHYHCGCECEHAQQKPHFNWSVGRTTVKEGARMLELTCTNEEKVKVTVKPVTPAGHPIGLDGPVQVSVQSGDGTVVLDPDGVTFWVVSGDNPGDTAYLVTADADLGAGVESISDIVMLHVQGAKASNLGLAAEAPVLK